MQTPAQRMSGLLDYLVEQAKEIDPAAFTLAKVTEFKKTFAELSTLPWIEFDVATDSDDLWLRVHRLDATPAPSLADPALAPYLLIGADPAGNVPALSEAALAAAQADAGQRARAAAALEAYLQPWQEWAARERPRRQVMALYADLFALKARLESEEAVRPLELVWGMGVASWRIGAAAAAPVDFHYPLITQALEIDIDATSHAIGLRPRQLDARLELDAFAACGVPGIGEVERAARAWLANRGDTTISPFVPSSIEPVLKLVAGQVSADARYDSSATQAPAPGAQLVVTHGWAIFARPRPTHYLIDDIARLKERVNSGAELPPGPLRLVTAPGSAVREHEPIAFRGLSGGATIAGEARELYFPLPYNREQETIVAQLARSPGVTVQGPPGTGKTHTIANIISHYLASGKRILVTSKGEPALKVLQEKIPASIRPLTVALLAGDKEGMRQFQASIEAIIHTLSHLNPQVESDAIAACRVALDRAHEETARIDTRIDEIAHAQLAAMSVDGVEMRAQKMAELVIDGQQQFGWFDDVLSLAPAHAPPFGDEQGAVLRAARRRLGPDLAYITASLPAAAALPSPAALGALHATLLSLRDIERDEASGALPLLRATTPAVFTAAHELQAALGGALDLAANVEAFGVDWVHALRQKCRQSQFVTECGAFEALFPEMDALLRARSEFMQRPVTAPTAALEHPKAVEAIARAVDTGKPFGLLSFGAGDVKPHIAAIRVAGLAPASAHDWAHVQRYAALQSRLQSFAVRWNAFAAELSLPPLAADVAQLRAIEQVLLAARAAHAQATTHDLRLPHLAAAVFSRVPVDELLGRHADLLRVRGYLLRHLARAELAQATAAASALRASLAGAGGPLGSGLRELALHALGQPGVSFDALSVDYASWLAELRRIEALAPDLDTVRAGAGQIARAGATRLATRVLSAPVDAQGGDAVFPPRWRDAWTWARLRTHLERIDARDEMRTLAARRRELEGGLARLYEELVSKSSWLATRRLAGENVLTALETYRTSMRKLGKGTGVNANRYRRDAQAAMVDAQAAVPCWIMSHARVSETLPATLGAFDLVIVDEASQSDLWALPAVLRGKQILVVGDDKQVSPEAGFVSAARITDLRRRFLAGQPFEAVLSADMSLYDIASTVFAASKVMLREHFRSVAPIIAYSNRVFYKGFIQPLRIPKASERLDPPLVDVFVANGYREGKGINRPEAEFIVAEITAILCDPAYAGRTLGVVSLLGPEQAQLIDKMVRSRCDMAELVRRNFACGDARLFQGSERDIIFLSMVADSKQHHALSGVQFDQRFNVAASRARDRMYLVRSVRLEELSTLDLRRTLVEHFARPLEANDDQSSLIARCESGFERDVYTELFERGYRVIPQVPAAGYRIDMVVEGAHDRRLAIELDGDEYHGPDRWQADMGRQRVLERAGWTFWRCFASTWSLQRATILDELLARLAAMGIEPLGALARTPSLVEYREWGREATELTA